MNEKDILDHPIRREMMAHIYSLKECSFSVLKNALKLTDGLMTNHTKILETNKYIKIIRSWEGNRPRTTYKLTKHGSNKFFEYYENIKKFVADIESKKEKT